ncbi:MAG: hypothetical protein ACFCU5_13730 [Pleurocapsa sp.]
MTTNQLFDQASDLSQDDYCILGVATCFVREEGEVHQIKVIEPIPSAALEALIKGVPTSYELARSMSLGEIFTEDKVTVPDEFPSEANLCDRFTERVAAATRTYKTRPEATKYIPLNTTKRDFNYSLAKKRVLNAANVVRTEDNIKQHEHTHKVL